MFSSLGKYLRSYEVGLLELLFKNFPKLTLLKYYVSNVKVDISCFLKSMLTNKKADFCKHFKQMLHEKVFCYS